MKKSVQYLFALFIICYGFKAQAQIEKDPAHWAYGLKKISGNTYEVHIRATIDSPWHIYAQNQTKDFIGTATKIVLTKQPGLLVVGITAEHGKKDKYKDDTVGILNYEYGGIVDFVQKVTLSADVKEIKGTVNYQTCTHTHCLNPTAINFSIPVK